MCKHWAGWPGCLYEKDLLLGLFLHESKLLNLNRTKNRRKQIMTKIVETTNSNVVIANQFSDSMIASSTNTRKKLDSTAITLFAVNKEKIQVALENNTDIVSFVRPAFTGILNTDLKINVEGSREKYFLKDDDVVIVARYDGPRLSPETTDLPEGATLTYRVAATTKTFNKAKKEGNNLLANLM